MNKARLEAFSDGVFAIVITLLILNVKEPRLMAPVTDAALWEHVGLLFPSIIIYSVFFYAFPVIFNIIPGTLDFSEKVFGFTLN